MASFNKVLLLGRLGQDPDLRFTPSGAVVCNFSIATSESWKDSAGEKQEKTQWHKVVVWGKSAEVCGERLKKGSQVCVSGKMIYRQWENKDDVKMTTAEVEADRFGGVTFISDTIVVNKEQNSSEKVYESNFNDSAAPVEPKFIEDSIPF